MESIIPHHGESIHSLHYDLIYEICSYLDLSGISQFMFTSKNYFNSIRNAPLGQLFLKKVLWRELGLVEDVSGDKNFYKDTDIEGDKSPYQNLSFCLKVYEEKVKYWTPLLHRFFGFRTNGGVDEDRAECSVGNLFVAYHAAYYCS